MEASLSISTTHTARWVLTKRRTKLSSEFTSASSRNEDGEPRAGPHAHHRPPREPHGAGKTTFINGFLHERARAFQFVNPDEVARGLPSLSSSSGKPRLRGADRGTQQRAGARPSGRREAAKLSRTRLPPTSCLNRSPSAPLGPPVFAALRRRMTKGREVLDWGPQ